MCVKLPFGDLNLSSYPPLSTSIYTCGVTTVPKIRSGTFIRFLTLLTRLTWYLIVLIIFSYAPCQDH